MRNVKRGTTFLEEVGLAGLAIMTVFIIIGLSYWHQSSHKIEATPYTTSGITVFSIPTPLFDHQEKICRIRSITQSPMRDKTAIRIQYIDDIEEYYDGKYDINIKEGTLVKIKFCINDPKFINASHPHKEKYLESIEILSNQKSEKE